MTPDDVPPGPLLIDTDVFSYILLKRRDWRPFAALIDGHERLLSFANVGELRAAPEKTGALWGEARRAELEVQIRQHIILPASDAVTRVYGRLHSRFHGQFSAGGHNDMWVAACAMALEQPVPVVTNNLKDFKKMAAEFSDLVIVHPDL